MLTYNAGMTRKTEPPRRDADATRHTILRAARQRFAADGYARATIRAIAGDAGVDPALVIRYFGSKELLFAAAARFDLRLPDLAGLPLREASRALVRHFLVRWEEDDTLMALLRVASTNDSAVAELLAVFSGQVKPLVQALSGQEGREAAERAGLVASQMLGLALTRYILRLPPLAAMDHETLVARVSPVIEHYLRGGDRIA